MDMKNGDTAGPTIAITICNVHPKIKVTRFPATLQKQIARNGATLIPSLDPVNEQLGLMSARGNEGKISGDRLTEDGTFELSRNRAAPRRA